MSFPVVEVTGIEPIFWEPKSHVLPLDDTSISYFYLAFLPVRLVNERMFLNLIIQKSFRKTKFL